jgi:hypothetical protein
VSPDSMILRQSGMISVVSKKLMTSWKHFTSVKIRLQL